MKVCSSPKAMACQFTFIEFYSQGIYKEGTLPTLVLPHESSTLANVSRVQCGAIGNILGQQHIVNQKNNKIPFPFHPPKNKLGPPKGTLSVVIGCRRDYGPKSVHHNFQSRLVEERGVWGIYVSHLMRVPIINSIN